MCILHMGVSSTTTILEMAKQRTSADPVHSSSSSELRAVEGKASHMFGVAHGLSGERPRVAAVVAPHFCLLVSPAGKGGGGNGGGRASPGYSRFFVWKNCQTSLQGLSFNTVFVSSGLPFSLSVSEQQDPFRSRSWELSGSP